MKPFTVFRPTLDDVERLSRGKASRRRRIGSRYVCHRLNRDERVLYEIAKESGFLSVQGSSYRKERKGSPVRNTFRQRCDALERLCIILEKRSAQDRLLIDFSTLRVKDDSTLIEIILQQVVKAKYPEMIESTQVLCQNQKIDWSSVLSCPIWNNDERLVVIHCDRHKAKSMAYEILKVSDKFDTSVCANEEDLSTKTTQNCEESHHKSSDTHILMHCNPDAMQDQNQCEDDSIDWSDI